VHQAPGQEHFGGDPVLQGPHAPARPAASVQAVRGGGVLQAKGASCGGGGGVLLEAQQGARAGAGTSPVRWRVGEMLHPACSAAAWLPLRHLCGQHDRGFNVPRCGQRSGLHWYTSASSMNTMYPSPLLLPVVDATSAVAERLRCTQLWRVAAHSRSAERVKDQRCSCSCAVSIANQHSCYAFQL
jgi:hypothetical protein